MSEFIFNSCNRGLWLLDITRNISNIEENKIDEDVVIKLPEDMGPDDLEPFHIVLISCFIEHIKRCGCSNAMILTSDNEIREILKTKLKMEQYFLKENSVVHEDSDDSTILNLWKVINRMTYAYSLSVSNYFNNKEYFVGLDTSGLTSALNEIYANIADHSKSGENAFSYISYNPIKNKIYIAACDFGLGIATTLKNSKKKYKSDSEALRDSVNIGVTAGSTKGNKGMGLDNILSTISEDDTFRIVSNKSLLVCFGNKKKINTYDLNFEFKGTLIYFELSTNSFPPKDIEGDDIIIY